jgi:hypothetical protein
LQGVVARVQAHPARAHLHQALSKALSPLPTEIRVHSSDPPDPWAGYRACLSDLPHRYSHALIVQDDVLPCRNFAAGVQAVANSNPEVPVCLFLGAMPSDTAARARRAWGKRLYIHLGPTPFVPLVAVLWPREKAAEFLDWSENAGGMTRADDGNAAKWARRTKQEILVTVPSLVQHNDGEPSVKGGREHKPWAEAWRRAVLLADDALDYEW